MYFCPMPHRFALLSLLCCVGLSAFHAQSWEPFASVPSGFVSDHSFGFALNGAGYLVAGQTPDGFSDNMFKYDPVTDTWSTLPDFPGPARGYTIGDAWSGEAWMGFGLGTQLRATGVGRSAGVSQQDCWRAGSVSCA